MITVRCLGHIATGVGRGEVCLEGGAMNASEVVERVRAASGKADPGFTKYNTLLLIEDAEAFVPAGSDRRIRDGSTVVLIPFSHGG